MSTNANQPQTEHPGCVVAEYPSPQEANVGLEVLSTDGFTAETVSYVSRHSGDSVKRLDTLKNDAKGTPESGRSMGLGAAMGGALATPLAMGTLIAPLFVAGPLLGMGLGATIGGLLTSTKKWGVDDEISQQYENRVRDGGVLVLVHDTPLRMHEAFKLLQTTAPLTLHQFEIKTSNPKPTNPKPNRAV